MTFAPSKKIEKNTQQERRRKIEENEKIEEVPKKKNY